MNQPDFPGLEDPAVMVSQDGKKDPVGQPLLRRAPVHIKVGGESAGSTILQDIPPPGILRAGYGHVIRHYIKDLAQFVFPQGCPEHPVSFGPAQLFVYAARIHHIISMGASRGGLKTGGGIEVSRAQGRQIARNGCGVIKREARMKLETISGQGDTRHLIPPSSAGSGTGPGPGPPRRPSWSFHLPGIPLPRYRAFGPISPPTPDRAG